MSALVQHHNRCDALDLDAMGRAVRIPEAPDHEEVISALAIDLLESCADGRVADETDLDWEPLINDQPEILRLAGECLNACQTRCWDIESRSDRMAAFGAEIMAMVTRRMKEIARHKLEREA